MEIFLTELGEVLAGNRVTTSRKIRKNFPKERKMVEWKKVVYLRIG